VIPPAGEAAVEAPRMESPPPSSTERPEPAASPAGIDWAGALRQVDGDPGLLQTIASAFLAEAPPYLDSIDGAIEAGQGRLLQRAAHTIKGGFRLFGAGEAYDLAMRLEEAGRGGRFEGAEATAARLRAVSRGILHELEVFAKTGLGAHNTGAPDLSPVTGDRG
jgi:two-component system sensor histidine kinase/response regulator